MDNPILPKDGYARVFARIPFFMNVSVIIIGIYFFVRMLSMAQEIILPLLYSSMFAVMLSPLVDMLERRKVGRLTSIMGIMIVSMLLAGLLLLLLASQFGRLVEAWPMLSAKLELLLTQCILTSSDYLNISEQKVIVWISGIRADFMSNSGTLLGNTLLTVSGMLATLVLTPVYILMILYYQPHLLEFMHKLFGDKNESSVSELLTSTKSIIQSYLSGLFIEIAILAVLNSLGLLLLGIDYAILLGTLGALLNVIPYLGGLMAAAAFAVIALVTKSPIYVVYVVALYSFIQIIDNNYIVPIVVGSKVKLNGLVCVVTVIVGAALWGIHGMFLSIPITAIMKLMLDKTDSLKAWGFLMGEPVSVNKTLDFIE